MNAAKKGSTTATAVWEDRRNGQLEKLGEKRSCLMGDFMADHSWSRRAQPVGCGSEGVCRP
ncbi:hypothetical protein IE4872_PC00402 (plasmid) [Rhizobium gallicum]|uniref:Uncharacterized protein n=1 Tax=Rhizobium gallicum TaxID=56730 RepID=A0A1L5NRE2_9HYPH|nr:hypothetical protein IE4872_PC00402 [Rhizobium gallicum]